MSDVQFIFADNDGEAHPCDAAGCHLTVPFDDEPFCYQHSPDSGSSVPGYSYRSTHPTS
jgi:hypothetical protein